MMMMMMMMNYRPTTHFCLSIWSLISSITFCRWSADCGSRPGSQTTTHYKRWIKPLLITL